MGTFTAFHFYDVIVLVPFCSMVPAPRVLSFSYFCMVRVIEFGERLYFVDEFCLVGEGLDDAFGMLANWPFL